MSLKTPPVGKPLSNTFIQFSADAANPDADDANRETWKQLRLETDKNLLQLSVGAIALLIGFVAPVGLVGAEVYLFAGALLPLVLCVGLMLRMMTVNSDIMETVIAREEEKCTDHEKNARRLEWWAKRLFAFAVVVAAVASIFVGVRVGKEREQAMVDKTFKAVVPPEEFIKKGLDGAYKVLVPTPPPAPVGQPSHPTIPASGGGDPKKE